MIQGESMLLEVGERELHIPVYLANKDATITREKLEN
jgi:hypothetical protein